MFRMDTEWEPPEDDAEFAAMMDQFAKGLPNVADQLGLTPEEVKRVQEERDAFCAAHEKEVSLRFDDLTRRLAKFRPRAEWPAVFAEAVDVWLLTPEPRRTRWLELLEKWFAGIRRVQGKEVRAVLTSDFFKQGIRLHYPFPEGTDCVSVYFREEGAVGWEFLCATSQPTYYLFTQPDAGHADRPKPGTVLEFVCIGGTGIKNPLGFPSEIMRVRVPVEYPVPGAAA